MTYIGLQWLRRNAANSHIRFPWRFANYSNHSMLFWIHDVQHFNADNELNSQEVLIGKKFTVLVRDCLVLPGSRWFRVVTPHVAPSRAYWPCRVGMMHECSPRQLEIGNVPTKYAEILSLCLTSKKQWQLAFNMEKWPSIPWIGDKMAIGQMAISN